jgi:hypothetical protein
MYAQAFNVIEKFRGARNLARAIQRSPSTVYKWTYEMDKGGTDGLIPSSALELVRRAAKIHGIELTADDLDVTKVRP